LNSTVKQLLIWVLALAILLVGWQVWQKNAGLVHEKQESVSELLADLNAGKVSAVTIAGSDVTGDFKDGKETFHTTIPQNYPDLYKNLSDHGVRW
jgi:cell division protease FtsH